MYIAVTVSAVTSVCTFLKRSFVAGLINIVKARVCQDWCAVLDRLIISHPISMVTPYMS